MLENKTELVILENYRDVCGVLSETSPRELLLAVNDDITTVLNKITEGTLNDPSTIFDNSFRLIKNDLAEHNKILNMDSALEYNKSLINVAKLYIDGISTKEEWWNKKIDVLNARYNPYNQNHLDVAIKFDDKLVRNCFNIDRDDHSKLNIKYKVVLNHVLGAF